MKLPAHIALWVFWISAGMVAYAYFLYPVVLFVMYAVAQLLSDVRYLLTRRDRRAGSRKGDVPAVTFLVPAYNEEAHLLEKIENLGQTDYPREKLQIVFVSDGSTDLTNQILSRVQNPQVEVVILPRRQGKPSALNVAVARARHDLLVFSDASTSFAPDAVEKLARHFTDSTVGAVCGALRFRASSESQQTEGVYWKFENLLRLMEARLGATLTASGAIYALRRQAYFPLAPDTVLDDFVIPMNARNAGYRVLYDPEAVATEVAPHTVGGEFTRRVRLASGSFAALRDFARIRLDGVTVFAFLSHKVCRWIVPFFLIALLISNVFLRGPVYRIMLIGQILFYLWAGFGFFLRRRISHIRYALLGYFLLAMNLAFLVGFCRFVNGRKDVIWQRVNS
jgi:cellulose synthase/poly-beta-1,6-N-acetylglucosamine synthase-like glycosyltransferase